MMDQSPSFRTCTCDGAENRMQLRTGGILQSSLGKDFEAGTGCPGILGDMKDQRVPILEDAHEIRQKTECSSGPVVGYRCS